MEMSEYQPLIEKLKSGTIAEKRKALESLRTSKVEVISTLISVIHEADDQHLGWTLEGYDHERGEGVKNNFVLIEDTIQYDYWYVFAITHLLVDFRAASTELVLPLLNHVRPVIRAWSAFVLGDIGDERAIAYLLERLNTTDETELWRVCEALGKLRAVDAVPRLIELLADEETGVDSAAAIALGQISDIRALMPLIEQFKRHKPSVYAMSTALYQFGDKAVLLLADVLFDENAKRVHDLALMELGMLKDQRAIEPILRYIETAQDTRSKSAAITALGRLKANQAVPQIAALFQTATDLDIRLSASMTLAAIGNRLAFETLVHELEHGTPDRQHDAALAFGQMEHIEDIEPLLNALKNGSPKVRSAIAVSLGNLCDRRAVPALKEALGDPDEYTRRYAQVGLDKIDEIDSPTTE